MAEQAAAEQSRTTHAAPAAMDACRVFARLLVRAIAGEPKTNLLAPWPDTTGLDPAVAAVMAGSWKAKSRDQIQSTGYVVHSWKRRSGPSTAPRTSEAPSSPPISAVTPIRSPPLPDSWRARSGGAAASPRAGARTSPGPPRSAISRPLSSRLATSGDRPHQATHPVRPALRRRPHQRRPRALVRSTATIPPDVGCRRARARCSDRHRGDALGNTSESLLPEERRRRYGEIRDYLPNRYAEGRRVGLPSDDTQLAFWTLELLLESGRLDVDELARRFSERRIFGIGQSVRTFLRNYKAGQEWPEAAARSAGNGALMRIAPVLVPHLRSPGPDLWVDAASARRSPTTTPRLSQPASPSSGCCGSCSVCERRPAGVVGGNLRWLCQAIGRRDPLSPARRSAPGYVRGAGLSFVAERLPQALAARKSACGSRRMALRRVSSSRPFRRPCTC